MLRMANNLTLSASSHEPDIPRSPSRFHRALCLDLPWRELVENRGDEAVGGAQRVDDLGVIVDQCTAKHHRDITLDEEFSRSWTEDKPVANDDERDQPIALTEIRNGVNGSIKLGTGFGPGKIARKLRKWGKQVS